MIRRISLQPLGPSECRAEREQLVKRQPQRVHVGPSVALAFGMFGGHVANRAQDVAGVGQVASSSPLARPKSVTQTVPSVSSSKFDGLMSRYTIPSLWRRPRTSATWKPI